MSLKILAKLIDTVKTAFTFDVKFSETHYRLDSNTTLFWINNRGD